MPISLEFVGAIISAAFIIFILSLPFKDNALYHISEHIFMGVAAAYGVVMAVKTIQSTAIYPLITNGTVIWVIPIILGLLMFGQLVKGYYWISRYPIAILVATGTAVALRTGVEADFLAQIRTILVPIFASNPLASLENLVTSIMVIATIYYFIFTVSGKGATGTGTGLSLLRYVGLLSLVFAFGSSFGNTIMGRVSLIIGICGDLMKDPAYLAIVPSLILVGLAMIPKEKWQSIFKKLR